MTAPAPDPTLGRWPVALEIPVQWGDMDAFHHVNNTVYLRWFESARIAYFERTGLTDRMKREGVGPILARATIDYRIPLEYPDRVRAEATVASLGNTSFLMRYRATSEARRAVAAEGEGVIVLVDYRGGGRKVPLDDEVRAAIRRVEAAGQGPPG